MEITVDSSLRANAELFAAVSNRKALLEEIINGSATVAEWSAGKNWKGQLAALLRLQDRSGARVGADLLPVEFKNEHHLGERLRALKDAIGKIHDWRTAVEKLFTAIRAWCDKLPPRKVRGTTYQVLVFENTILVAEGPSGEYDIAQLEIKRISAVRVTPVAAWVVGWDGRVDLTGPGDRCILLYRQNEKMWYHVPNDLPYREMPLTEVLFLDLVETCLDEDLDE